MKLGWSWGGLGVELEWSGVELGGVGVELGWSWREIGVELGGCYIFRLQSNLLLHFQFMFSKILEKVKFF